MSLEDRVLARRTISADGCWISTYRDVVGDGYVRVSDGGRMRLVHIVAHELWIGPVPDGYQVDHLCRTPACFNPDHLQAVTPQENVRRSESPAAVNARKQVCKRGHPYDRQNSGGRYCSRCHVADKRERRRAA